MEMQRGVLFVCARVLDACFCVFEFRTFRVTEVKNSLTFLLGKKKGCL